MDYKVSAIYDDSYSVGDTEIILGISLAGKIEDIPSDVSVILAIGNNEERSKLFMKFADKVIEENIIAPTAYIGNEVEIGRSNQIFHHSLINACAKIGNNNIINSKALIEPESVIGNNCHISIASIIGGRVEIGDNCFIGAGAIIKDKIKICSNVIIGAGAVVVKSIAESGTYVGNPIRKIK